MKLFNLIKAAGTALISLALLGSIQSASAHGVQIGYGVLSNGFVRVYVEHWHGDHPGLSNSPLRITVTSAAGTSTATYNAQGEVPNTAWNNLPGLGSSITILQKCPNLANTYNDWLYWDFAPGTCNVPVSITIEAGLTVVTTEACSGLYPQTITGQVFTDQSPPVITAPNVSAVGDCTGANVSFAPSVVDDCDKNPVVSYSRASGSFFPVGVTPVTVTATDNTGKTSVSTFNVTVAVGNTTPPTLTVPSAITVGSDAGKCGANVTFATSAAGSCSAATVVDSPASGSFFPVGTSTVTSVATDGFGHAVTKTFTVTVKDTELPTITSPADMIVSTAPGTCSANVSFAAVAQDNCSGVAISYSADPGSLFTKGTTIVTATATDASGNVASSTFNVTVVDNQPPTLTSAAANSTIECSGSNSALSAWLAANGGASAIDNCGPVMWSNNFAGLTGGCGSTGSATVAFTATDTSGNATTSTATFTVVDTTAPVIGAAASNKVVECDGAGNKAALNDWLANHGGATATDVCSTVKWSNNFTALTSGAGATGSATVVFTATDGCGNASSTTSTFTIVDTTAPLITSQATNKLVECDGSGNTAALSAWLASNGGAVVSDVCSAVKWSNNFTALTKACGATGSTTVTFTATDASGNTSSTTATFTISDTTAPVIVAPAANRVVECDGAGNTAALSAWVAANGGASATDACGTVKWSNNFTALTTACGATGSATVTFTATDECGNATTTTATFTIADTTAPKIIASAASKTVETDGAGNTAALSAWVANNAGASATDSCGSVKWSNNFTKLVAACGATGSSTVTFTATDECGNMSTSTATFTIVDTTKPVLSSNVHVISPNQKPVTFTVTSSDVGGNSTPSISQVTAQRFNGAGKLLDFTGTYKYTLSGNQVTIETSGGVGTFWTIYGTSVDSCGNTAAATYVVNVVNPTLTK